MIFSSSPKNSVSNLYLEHHTELNNRSKIYFTRLTTQLWQDVGSEARSHSPHHEFYPKPRDLFTDTSVTGKHGYLTRFPPQARRYWCHEGTLSQEKKEEIEALIPGDRAFEKGRQPASTRIGVKRIHTVRTRGGNRKFRALRLDSGNFSWGSEGIAKKVRIITVTYHPSNNEFYRTNTLTKAAVVQVDAAPFRVWYEAHYGQPIGRRRQQKQQQTSEEEQQKKSKAVQRKQARRMQTTGKVEQAIEKQFEAGRLYAVVSSRPGQSGRCDGYVLEGDELAFYQRLMRK